MKIKNTIGFTILEILVVISVIAILIGVAVPRFKGMQDEAKVAKARAEVKTLMLAMESYKMHSNPPLYPDSTTATQDWQSVLTSASPKMISQKLYDPFGADSTTEYSYMSSANRLYYAIWSRTPGSSVPNRIDADGALYY